MTLLEKVVYIAAVSYTHLARLEERKIAMRNEYDNLTSKLYDEYQLTRREDHA